MKQKSFKFPLIFLLMLTYMTGCEKDEPKNVIPPAPQPPKDYYSGTYNFITTATAGSGSTIVYDGYIIYDTTAKMLTINYVPEVYDPIWNYTIYPGVDNKGVLTYPEWTNLASGFYFIGKIDTLGNVWFKIGKIISHHGTTFDYARIVTGKKRAKPSPA